MANFDPNPAPPVLACGTVVQIRGHPEYGLGDHACCVLGGPQTTSRGDGFVLPVAVAPMQPTEPLRQLFVRPEDCTPCNAPPYVLANIWNTLALVFKASTIDNRYAEAAAAYDTALEINPGMPAILANYIKLCGEWANDGGDGQALMSKFSAMLHELFQPISSRPEFRGLDASAGYDVVPGYEQRMLHFGVVASVDGAPVRTRFTRLWVYDPDRDDLVEIDAAAGLPMGVEAQEAVRRGPGTQVATDSAGRVNLLA